MTYLDRFLLLDRQWGTEHQYLLSHFLDVSILQLLTIYRIYDYDMLSRVTLKQHLSIGVFVVYIDTGSPVPNILSKSYGLVDENKKKLTEWKWFETTILGRSVNPPFSWRLHITIT
jgi:hypothetical protein